MKLASVLLLAILLSGCYSTHLITTRDIKAGEVIQASDLTTDQHSGGLWPDPKDWGWATRGDRSKIVGHKAKIAIGYQWHFRLSEIER